MINEKSDNWVVPSPYNRAEKLRVLLAEDTPISAEAMKAMARRFSVNMDVASNGLEAIEMVKAAMVAGEPYQLLLVDVMMPVLDGVETAKRLRASGINADTLPIIAVTAATSLDEVHSYKAAGIQAFLSKPVALKDLRATLHAWGYRTTDEPIELASAVFTQLRKQYTDRNRETLSNIETVLASDPSSEEQLLQIRNALHQIAGTAATLGDPELSELAREFETNLCKVLGKPDEVRTVLRDAASALKKRVSK